MTLLILFGLSSCVKKEGPTKACFVFSKETAKVNDTIFLLNCSENYAKSIWINSNGFYPGGSVIDTVSRHQRIVVSAAGPYSVYLRVGKNDVYTTSTGGYSEIMKTINVSP
jgi:hypothetical protein